MAQPNTTKSYATFGASRSWQQLVHAFRGRRTAEESMTILLQMLHEHEVRMEQTLGKPIENLRMLEIGPGQGMERARYFGLKNEVVGIDLDVIPQGFDLAGYFHMLRKNGLGRFAKTVGRKAVIGGANSKAWAKAVGTNVMPDPPIIHGDICNTLPEMGRFDVIMSWSVFEHLPDPKQALTNVIRLLEPGGIFYISLHLYTSDNGHHDIRAFTGQEHALPLWPHLRDSTSDQIDPSSYLNAWRINQWRELFCEIAPGHTEFLEAYDCRERLGSKMTDQLRKELSDYTNEELYTVDVIYAWRKPGD